MSKVRQYKWDNLKALLILCVVIGHMIEPDAENSEVCRALFVFVYTFHMPLFLFISGYFHKNTNIKNKIIFYLVLGVLLRIMTYCVHTLAMGEGGDLKLAASDGVHWFFFALAAHTALAYLFRDYDKYLILILALILGCFSGYDQSIGDFLTLSRIIVFFPFYWCGYCLHESGRFSDMISPEKKYLKYIKAAAGLLVIVLWAYLCLNRTEEVYELRPFFTGRNAFSQEYALSVMGLMTRIKCYVISAVTGLALICMMPDGRIPVISGTGERSLSVCFWHRLLIYIIADAGLLDLIYEIPYGTVICIGISAVMTLILGTKVCFKPLAWLRQKLTDPHRTG